MAFAGTWMDLEIIILSKVSQKDKYHMISLVHRIYNMTQMNLPTRSRNTQREQTCATGEGRVDWEFGVSACCVRAK